MRKAVLSALLVATLAACGLKGPLYLPEQKPIAVAPAAATGANTQAEDKKTPGSK